MTWRAELAFVTFLLGAVEMNEIIKKAALDSHNKYRAKAGLKLLKWDTELERKAKFFLRTYGNQVKRPKNG